MHNYYTELQKQFHYATRLPICLYDGTTIVASYPAQITTIHSILKNEDFSTPLPVIVGQKFTSQYIRNAYYEEYIYFELNDGYYFLVGPLLYEPILDGGVTHLIRTEHLPIKRKSVITDYYRSLIILSMDNYYYTGKLLEQLFLHELKEQTTPLPTEEYSTTNLYLKNPNSTELDHLGEFESTKTPSVPENFYTNTYKNRMESFLHSPYFLETEICRLVTLGDKENALKILSQINVWRRPKLANEPVRSLRNSMIASCTFLTRAAITGGVSPDEAFTLSDAYIEEIETSNTLKDLNNMEIKMILGFIDLVNKIKEIRYSRIIHDLIEYIQSHLSEKLTIPTLSAVVFVHPNYLSTLFKKEVGLSLSQYIVKRRIEEAQYLIRYSNNSISDIAAFYQFSSQSHFISIFKRATGLTPKQYRNQFI